MQNQHLSPVPKFVGLFVNLHTHRLHFICMKFWSRYKEHYKALIQLGVPIVIGQIGIVVVGLADNMMVGQYATLDLAAASFVNSAFNIPILFGLGFSYGLTPLVGQFFGRHDKYHVGQLLRNSLLVNLFIGLLLTLAMTVVWVNIDRLGQPEELLPLIRPYFLLQLASLVFVMLFNSFKQFADGITDTKTPMYIMISANLVNIAGNYILIYGKFGLPALGVVGAGISTLTARILMFAAFAVLFYRSLRYRRYLVGYKRGKYNFTDILSLNKMGWMVGLQMGLETALFSITGIMIGWLGSIALAAHQVMVAISTLGFMIYYGVGAAVSVRVSNYFGRQELLHVRRTTMAGFHLILCLAVDHRVANECVEQSLFVNHLLTPPVFPAAKTSFPGPASQILLNHLNMDLPSPQENTSALSGFLTGSLWIHFVFV